MTDTRHSSASHKHWKLNWWDLWPLVENDERPIQWTSESLILSAHQPIPAVSARLFPSTYTFLLPSPSAIIKNPNAYSPPTIIEASPALEHIFAYFPGKTEDNLACIWNRIGKTLDTWKADTSWPIKRGQGVVAARWLGRSRSWSAGNPPSRGCSLGPSNPFESSRLVFVTQNHLIHLVDHILPHLPFQIASCSILHSSRCHAAERVAYKDMINGPGGVTVCTKAAIGLGYDEKSLIVATQSALIASATNLDFPDFTTMNQPPLVSQATSACDSFGLEKAIQLCEVRLSASRFLLCVETTPLLPIIPRIDSFSYLTNISIVPVCAAHQGNSTKWECESEMYVTLAYVDLEDHSSPKSHLLSYLLKRKEQSQSRLKRNTWAHTLVTNKTLTDKAVAFLSPSKRDQAGVIFAGLLDLHSIRLNDNGERDSQQVVIGKIAALRIPTFEHDPRWEPSNLMGVQNETGFFIPTSGSLSPNETLLCTANSSWDYSPKASVHPITSTSTNIPLVIGSHPIQELLAASILSLRTDADILHLLSGPNVRNMDAYQMLFDCLRILKKQNLAREDVDYDILKVIIPLFQTRARLTGSKRLKARSDTALDICSIRALKNAFISCKEEVGYDPEPAWNLIALVLWFMDFLLRLFRDLILLDGYLTVFEDLSRSAPVFFDEKDDKTTVDDDPTIYSIPSSIMHLVHPYALRSFIDALSHVNAFRAYLDTLTASKLRAVLAKEVLVDTQDDSGLNLKELESELRKISQMDDFKILNETLFQKSLCMMHPVPELYSLVSRICRQLLRPEIVSRSRVFIEAKDVVIAVGKPAPVSPQERDMISRATLAPSDNTRVCAVCKGKTEVGNVPLPKGKPVYSPWALWEHSWTRCVCGGVWLKASSNASLGANKRL